MSEKRQKNQVGLAFTYGPKGEARKDTEEGTEAHVAKGVTEHPTGSQRLMEAVSASIDCLSDSSTSRTAVYGPVRTVVWEGWSREAPPYPDSGPALCAGRLGAHPGAAAKAAATTCGFVAAAFAAARKRCQAPRRARGQIVRRAFARHGGYGLQFPQHRDFFKVPRDDSWGCRHSQFAYFSKISSIRSNAR